MRNCYISVLSILAAVPLGSLTKPFSPRWDDMRVMHAWSAIPSNWETLGYPPAGTTIDLYFALKPDRENALIDALNEVSSPGHPKYRAHLSKEQVAELVAPHPNTLELVNSWLEHHGVPSSSVFMTHGGNTLMLKGVPVTQANVLLDASYQLFRHVESETIVRTVGYALPAALHGHVLTVAPTTSFLSPPTQWQTPRNLSSGRAAAELVKPASEKPATMVSSRDDDIYYVTPSIMRWLYEVSAYTPAATDKNVLGIMGYPGDYPSFTDMVAFSAKYCSPGAPFTLDSIFTVIPVNGGGYESTQPNARANLDIQYAEAMAHPTPLIFYNTGRGPSGTEDWFITSLAIILNQQSIPQTISMSYFVEEDTLAREYSMYLCYLFAQLGLRGVSILVSTGQSGVGQGNCVTSDGSIQFRPNFPATCPYVTAVGGATEREPEIASRFSGGGFSNHFPRPIYQRQALSTFFRSLGKRYRGLYNFSGRGIPDIAAQAIGLPIVLRGNEEVPLGTSGSTAVVAGIISLLNDYLLSKGQEPLGFLNPWLYGSGFEALWDIASGTNPGCDTVGFSAINGWDPVTGHGTPDLGNMLHVLPPNQPITPQ